MNEAGAAPANEAPASAASIASLKGIGAKRARDLNAAGIDNVLDLALRFPLGYEVLPPVVAIGKLPASGPATVAGRVERIARSPSRRFRTGHLKLRLVDESGAAAVAFYGQGYLQGALARGDTIWASGTVAAGGLELNARRYGRGDAPPEGLVPRYGAVGDIKPATYAALARQAALKVAGDLKDVVPAGVLARRDLVPIDVALRSAHAPCTVSECNAAERRLLYNAYLALALDVAVSREGVRPARARDLGIDDALVREVAAFLPFTLTPGQAGAVDDVVRDLGGARAMRRLLQGDVGSGKTAVAVIAVLATALRGGQAAVLAPTDALARQFHTVLDAAARQAGIKVGLLTGGQTRAGKQEVLHGLQSMELHAVAGTHALLENAVAFHDLALVVVDEQHKFGVMQRLRLVEKGAAPHLLVMSATPIPRTLALTLHGDLDKTEIRGLPPGRRPVATEVALSTPEHPYDWSAIASAIRAGAQAFIVFPSIDGEDEDDARERPALLAEGREIYREYFRGIRAAALHGRMSAAGKAEALDDFRAGRVRILFATTVVEVGVDVPAAEIMAVVGADCFGLAQLHQLRGRVGRGGTGGRCVLIAGTASARARLQVLARAHDGFEIAERDLELRGPGDMMGVRQHGAPGAIGSREDEALLHAAFEDADGLRGALPDVREAVAWLRRCAKARPIRGGAAADAG